MIAWVQENSSAPLGDRNAVTICACVMAYLRRVASKKPSHERSRIAARQILEYWGTATVADLTPQRQQAFIEHLRTHREIGGRRKPGTPPPQSAKPRTPETISNILSVLRAALNNAVKWQELTSAPFIFDVNRPKKVKEPMTVEEVARLLDAADRDYLRTFIWLTLGTAGRKEAVLELTWFQVNLHRRRIFLNPEGREQTTKRRGVAPIGDALMLVLLRLPSREGHLVSLPRTKRGEVVGYAQLDDIKAAWHRARAAAGLPARVTPNLLRHTIACELRARGVPEGEVSGFMAHRWSNTTTEGYASWRPDYLGQASAAVDAVLNEIGRCCKHRPIDQENRGASQLLATAASSGLGRPLEIKDLMVGATGIEPVTPTMST